MPIKLYKVNCQGYMLSGYADLEVWYGALLGMSWGQNKSLIIQFK